MFENGNLQSIVVVASRVRPLAHGRESGDRRRRSFQVTAMSRTHANDVHPVRIAARNGIRCIERDIFPLARLDHVSTAHQKITGKRALVAWIPLDGCQRLAKIFVCPIVLTKHQITVRQPRQRVKILATFRKTILFICGDQNVIRVDIRVDDLLPHSKLQEYVRRHVQRMSGRRRDVCVHSRRGQRENRMIRVIERMNDQVSCARVILVFRKDFLAECRSQRLPSESLVPASNGAQERQRVEDRNLMVVRPTFVHARLMFCVGEIPLQLVAR